MPPPAAPAIDTFLSSDMLAVACSHPNCTHVFQCANQCVRVRLSFHLFQHSSLPLFSISMGTTARHKETAVRTLVHSCNYEREDDNNPPLKLSHLRDASAGGRGGGERRKEEPFGPGPAHTPVPTAETDDRWPTLGGGEGGAVEGRHHHHSVVSAGGTHLTAWDARKCGVDSTDSGFSVSTERFKFIFRVNQLIFCFGQNNNNRSHTV